MHRYLFLALLATALSSTAQGVATPKDVWLANLRPMMTNGLCAAQSPLMKVFKGSVHECPSQIGDLYTKCTTQVPEVVIPETLTSERQANLYGSVIAECISAHYMGGEVLKSFLLQQERYNKASGGGAGG